MFDGVYQVDGTQTAHRPKYGARDLRSYHRAGTAHADEIRAVADIQCDRLVEAFAEVPREVLACGTGVTCSQREHCLQMRPQSIVHCHIQRWIRRHVREKSEADPRSRSSADAVFSRLGVDMAGCARRTWVPDARKRDARWGVGNDGPATAAVALHLAL